jgi:polyribonucleotide 5'-hydroxyl-kinase
MTATETSNSTSNNNSDLPPLAPGSDRHILKAEEELRLEVSFQKQTTCKILLQQGSCELYGVELALNREYVLSDGGLKLALFTWYGCVLDISCESSQLEICYTADASETSCNIAFVNTHAQLEARRDEAAVSGGSGPRVLIVGPPESGKSSLAKILTAYACKLGRTPLLVDLDPADNMVSVPGTLAVCPMNRDAITVESYATTGIPPGTASPLTLWHGSGSQLQSELFTAQVRALGHKINQRLQADDWERSSGLIVNTHGGDQAHELLLETIQALQITVVLVLGHDRLYSMLKNSVGKIAAVQPEDSVGGDVDGNDDSITNKVINIIKLPRSGGVVSRNAVFLRNARSRAMKRYFYGDWMESQQSNNTNGGDASSMIKRVRVPQLTPFLQHLAFSKVTIYKFASISLSASLLPVAAAQTTEPVQLVPVDVTEQLQHMLLAVCHPQAVVAYHESGRASDLYEAGVAGFCVVEKVLMESDMLHLLSPCAGVLPSNVLLVGDIVWMD